jgi:OmpA family
MITISLGSSLCSEVRLPWDETREAIFDGKPPGGSGAGDGKKIEIDGYTSNTDTQERNFKLSLDRATTVMKTFASFGVPESVFAKPRSHGESETHDDHGMKPTDDKREEKESAEWRKVVIKIWWGETLHVQ